MFYSNTYAINAPINDDFPTNFAFVTKALPSDRPMDQPRDQRTNQQADIPSCRDAIAASKNTNIT